MASTAAILRTEPWPEPPAIRESAARPVSVLDPERAGDVLRVTIAGGRRQHAADGRA
jgi:hypothetical protein